MRESAIDRYAVMQAAESVFHQQKIRLVIRMLVLSAVVIFSVETLLMLSLEFILPLSDFTILILDGLFLFIFLFPLNFYFIVRPMLAHIDAQHQTEIALSKSHEMVERFFSISDVLIAYLDADFNFIRVNKAYAVADQHDQEYYVGKNHFVLFPNEENQAIFEDVVRSGKSFAIIDKPFSYADHPERGVSYWDWSLLPIKDPSGRVIELMMVLNNVTGRKMAQLAKTESERRFIAVFNQTFQQIALLEPTGAILNINQTALNFTGMTQDQMIGKPLWEIPCWNTEPSEIDRLQAAICRAASGETVHCEHQVKCGKDGESTLEITIKPLLDETGKPTMLIYEGNDITTRIKDQEALVRGEEEIKRLYEAEMRAHHLAETLRSAALALSGSLDSGTVLDTLLDHLYRIVPYTSAHINLLDDEEHLVVRHGRGEENWADEDHLVGKRFEISELPLFQPLLDERKTLSISDTQVFSGEQFLPNPQNVRSLLGIPLLAGDLLIGMCVLEHHSPGFFTEDYIQWASTLTGQAAVAIQNAWLFEQVRDGREHLQALSRRLVEAQESERHHIARELHDDAGQTLASLMFGLRLLEQNEADQPSVVARCQELRVIADGVMENLHRLAIDLRPPSLDHLGLVSALRQHTEMISDQHKLTVQFETVGKIERLPEDTETAIYRIVQEALTNVVRHSCASRVDILLERREEKLLVIVEDNGIGFDPQQISTNHLGLIGMKERADMLGGTITIESAYGKGSTILLEVPCPSES